MKCYECGIAIDPDKLFCQKHLVEQESKEISEQGEKRRKSLTEWQRMKLGFYRNEKKWHDNIRMRTKINGQTVLRDYHGNVKQMPSARDR